MRSLRPQRTGAAYRAALMAAGDAAKAALARRGLRMVDASGCGLGIINHDLLPSKRRGAQRDPPRAVDEARMTG